MWKAIKDKADVLSWWGGAKKEANTDWSCLKGKEIYLWPDNDEPGRVSMANAAALIRSAGASRVMTVEIPETLPGTDYKIPEKWDAADAIKAAGKESDNGIPGAGMDAAAVWQFIQDNATEAETTAAVAGTVESPPGDGRKYTIKAIADKRYQKIRKAAEDGSLVDTKDLPLVLYRWKEFESAEAVRAYAAELLKTEEGRFSLIRGFVSEAHSQAIGDSVPRITRTINRNALGEFADLDELDGLVRGLDERALSPEKAELLKLYKNPTESF